MVDFLSIIDVWQDTDKSYKLIWVNEIFLFKEVNSFKKQLVDTFEIDHSRIQSQTDNINISAILERLIVQLQDQVSTLKNQLDKKD